MTIYDAYPKSIFHFLVLPRATSPGSTKPVSPKTNGEATPRIRLPSAFDLSSLRTLLNSKNIDKQAAKGVLTSMKDEGMKVKSEIEQEMEKRYGFVWDVWLGFHAVPSMEWVVRPDHAAYIE
jgi:aprataxin